jgi:type IV pilus biogenesis protein PilP
MSWFLERRGEQPPPPLSRPLPSRAEQRGAAFEDAQIRDDAWFRKQRHVRDLEKEIVEMIGEKAVLPDREDWARATGPDTRAEFLMERAAPIAARDPARYGRLPLTREQFDAEITRRRQDELEEAQEIMDMGDAPISQLLGSLAGYVFHPVNIAMMAIPFGAIRNTGRFVAASAATGAVAETLIIPDAQRVAEDLGLPDVNAPARIAFGAVAGAAIGGVMSGAVRGFDYLRLRAATEAQARPANANGLDHEVEIDLAEAALRNGDDLPPPVDTSPPIDRSTPGGQATEADVMPTDVPAVMGTSGPEGAQAAMIKLPDGTVMTQVRAGDMLPDGSRVTAVTSEGVTVERAGQTITARIGEGLAESRQAAPGAPGGVAQGNLTDDEILSRIIGVESGGNATAQNPRSSARGLGQFIQSTWLDMIGRHRPDITAGKSRAEILALRDDPQLNADMTMLYLRENRAQLQAAGVPTDPGALYLAHFMGPGGAVQALRAAADTPISRLMSNAAISANAPIRHNGRSFAQFTAADLRSWASAKMGQPVASGRFFSNGAVGDPGGRSFPDMPEGRARPGMTQFDEVVTPGGTRVPVRYSVVELDSLRPASGQFQPRDRAGRVGSDEQIAEIAASLDAGRLMPSREADRGAPIIGPDRMIESGNGRVAAIGRAAELHPERYDAYVRAVRDAGFDIPADMRRPVLVAERRGDMTDDARRAFVSESNDTATMRMSATEQAGRDADFLTQGAFDAYRPGAALNAAEQGEFLRRMLAQMPQAERAAMMTGDGRLNVDGVRRVRQALFARAYAAPDLLRDLAESPNPQTRAMLNMLEDLAPDWAAFRAAVDAGFVRAEFDLTDPMIDMVRTIARARGDGREGQSVIAAIRDRMAQADMFAARDNALMEGLLSAFYKGERARRPEATGDILRRYVAEAQIAGRADADDLFSAPPTPREVVDHVVKNHEARTPFDMPAPTARADAAPVAPPDVHLINPARTADGAASPALVRAADDIEAELRAVVAPRPAAAPDAAPSAQASAQAGTVAAQGADAAATAAARAEFDALRDLVIRLDENGPEFRVRDILDDLTRDAELSDAVRVCGLGRGGA